MKTQRILTTSLFLLFVTGNIMAQDVILIKDNTTILSKVLEISNTEIKYKKWSNQDGPTYTINCSEVTRINFQNGEVEQFTTPIEPTPAPQQPVSAPQPVVSQPVAQTPQAQIQPKPEKPKSPYARGKVQFSINGGVSFPMGEFGRTDNDFYCAAFSFGGDELKTGCGAAKTGFNASLKLHIPVYEKGKDIIGVPVKFNVMYNGITDVEKRAYRELWQNMGPIMNEQHGSNAYKFQVTTYPFYMNYSLMAGVDYTHYFAKAFGLFVEGNIGLNLAQITKSDINNLLGGSLVYVDYANHIQYYSGDGMKVSYKTKVDFAYEIGGGLFLFDCISIGVYYTGFTPFQVSPTLHEYSSTYSDVNGVNEASEELTAPKLPVSALSIQLGIHF